MPQIHQLDALEILDSRGRPTLEVRCALDDGSFGRAQVPSGASTGAAEALELRDGDPRRHAGLGCLQAVDHVRNEIQEAVRSEAFMDQRSLDTRLIECDGSPNKSRLGANALLGVSLAFARAHAVQRGLPLFRHLSEILPGTEPRLPRPTINLFSGGKHAGGQVAIQDVLVVPCRATTMVQALEDTCAVFRAAAKLTAERYGTRALVADEGGLAPPFPSADQMIADAVTAIERADLKPGRDVALAIDVASSHFHHAGIYHLDGQALTALQMRERLATWVERYPVTSLEDGLAEEAWEDWPPLVNRLGSRCLVLGDDFLCTNPGRIRRAAESRAANALLLKVNQIGTLTEAAEALTIARRAAWQVTVSARSGETEDDWLADLAVGWAGDFIKIGSITRSERLAKYNRLLAIERDTGLPMAPGTTQKNRDNTSLMGR